MHSAISAKPFRWPLCAGGLIAVSLLGQTADPSLLEPGQSVDGHLKGGEAQEYRFNLKAGEYARVQVLQHSIAVTLSVLRPDGEQQFEIANGANGTFENAEIVAAQSGIHRVRISPLDKTAPDGRFTVSLRDVDTATDRQKERAVGALGVAQARSAWAPHTREGVLKATSLLEGTLVHWRAAEAPIDEASTYYLIALTYAEAADREKAMQNATKALSIARASKDPDTEGWALNTEGALHNSFGDRRKAIEYFDQALPLMRSSGDRAGEAEVLNGLGMTHARIGELRAALDYFRQAVPIFTALQNRARLATVASNMGVTYGELGEYQKSLEEYEHALALNMELGNRVSEAITRNNIGTAYSSLAEYQKGLDAFLSAMEIHRSLGRNWDVAINLHNVAWVHANLGDPQRAISLYQEALAILRKVNDQPSTANVLNNLGDTFAGIGDHKKALEYHTEALALRQSVGDRGGEGGSLANIGKAYASLGQKEEAAQHFARAIAILRETGNRRRLAATLRSAGSLYREMQDYERAASSLDESLEISRAIHERRSEADTLAELARLERDRGEIARAHQRAGEALDAFESLRLTVASPNLRASFFAAVQDLQEMDIALLMKLDAESPGKGFAATAFLENEKRRARSLLELLSESGTEIRRGVDASLTGRERELVRLISAKAEQQTRLLNGKSSAPQASAIAKELDALTTELEHIEGSIRETSPQYAALTQPRPLDLTQIQTQVLDPNTALLEFSLGAGKSFLWTITRTSADVFELPPRAEIDAAALRVYELLTARNQNPPNETPAARAVRIRQADRAYFDAAANLSRMLLGETAPKIQGKRLLIVADGALQYLPFGSLPEPLPALTKGTRPPPLIVNHEIVTAPSASVVAAVRQEFAGRRPAGKVLAVLADPVFSADDSRVTRTLATADQRNIARQAGATRASGPDAGPLSFVRLRFSRTEAEEIARLAPAGATLKALDFDANRETVLASGLGQYRIIHFATHSVLNNEHPELSGVVLSRVDAAGRPQNGFLRLYDIYNLHLNSDLVVLSACETALGGEVKGEGLIGLTRGFLYAGAPRVVSTLWKIDDRATAEIMKRFYEVMLGRGERPAAALRSAQTSMWKSEGWDSPYYWAAFTLQGEWR